jgi:hypothetical protein
VSDLPWRDCGVNVCGADFFARNGSGRCAQRRGRQPTGKASYSIAAYSLACRVLYPARGRIGRKEYGGSPVEVSVFIRWINQEESFVRGLPCAATRRCEPDTRVPPASSESQGRLAFSRWVSRDN